MDLIREIWQTMRTNRLRTILTGIAVTWGVFMLITLLGLARGITENMDRNINSRDKAMIRIYPGTTTIPYKGNKEGRDIRLGNEDIAAIKDKNKYYVRDISARIEGGGKISTPEATVNSSYTGIYPSALADEMRKDTITEGRYINDLDMQRKAKVMMISRKYAEQLFPSEGKNALGSYVTCNGLSYKVIGIYSSEWNNTVYIPFTTAMALMSDDSGFGSITVMLKNLRNATDGKDAETKIRETLSALHKFDPDDKNAVYISNRFTNALQANEGMKILDTSVWVLGILTLLTGIVGVSNIMFVTVRERTHEIGIRRAIGAKPRKILTQIIAEAVAVTLTFGYIGVLAGAAAVAAVVFVTGKDGPMEYAGVDFVIATEVTAVLVVSGACAGLFPAIKALKVKPVEALRDE